MTTIRYYTEGYSTENGWTRFGGSFTNAPAALRAIRSSQTVMRRWRLARVTAITEHIKVTTKEPHPTEAGRR